MMIDNAEFREWIDALYRHPEWRQELRRVVLTDEILELPNLVREIVEIQKRTEQRVGELSATVQSLVEAQNRSEERIGRLENAVAELTEAQKRSEERIGRLENAVAELAEAQKRSEERIGRLENAVAELAEAQKRSEERIGRLENAVAELAEAQKRSEERIGRLENAVAELTEAQKRTEQRVEELAEAQKRSEERIGRLENAVVELAEAQKRSEERIGRLENAVAELAEAQKRTEQRVEELAGEQQKLWVAVGGLQRVIGASVEDEAAGVAEVVLRRKGYRILQPGFSLPLDGEIDVVLPLEDSSGRRLWAMVEAKARLTGRDVRAWSQRMHDLAWHERLKSKGVSGPYLVYAYGIRVDLGALDTAEKEGIGLLKGDGEILAPQGLIEPQIETDST
jgi:phage shock protein A